MDDGMDDDMMDKISSSPSIVDGGSSRACVGRDDSPTSSQHPRTPPRQFSRAEEFSSSPYVQTPDRLPISFVQPARDQSDIHHQIGEYQDGHAEPDHWDGYSSEERDQLTPLPSDRYCHVPESPESRADVEDAYVEGEYEGSSTDGDHSEDQAPSLSARLTDVQEEFENEEAFFTPAESPSGFFQEDQDNEDSLGEDYADEERDQLTPLPSERLSYFREEFETAEEEDEPEEEPNIVVHRPRLFNLGRFSRRPLPPLPSLPLLGPLPIPSLPFLRYTPPQPTDSPMDDRIRTAAVDRPTRPSYPEDPGGEDSYFYGRPNEYHSDAGDESAEESDDDADYFTFIRKRIANAALTEYDYLHRLEDIDFEFVYALHTFVATVEGQANATKGDTMVLLDDSNSYWWLVRVVKDSSIGNSWRFHQRDISLTL